MRKMEQLESWKKEYKGLRWRKHQLKRTDWAPCADESSGRVIEGMLCRRRGNIFMGFEEEEKGM